MTPSRAHPIELVVDSSAIVAIALGEPAAQELQAALAAARGASVMSTGNALECLMVIARRFGADGIDALDDTMAEAQIVTMPVDDVQLAGAREAWLTYGKGRHPAALNFGDCFTYALAKHLGVPVLCAGDDFAKTDLELAVRSR